MGSLSKRQWTDLDLKHRFEDLRTGVGHRIDDIRDQVNIKGRKLNSGLETVPSTTWLMCAGASLLGSLVLKALGKKHASLYVGQFVPTFLILALARR